MGIFTPTGGRLVNNLQVNSVDDGGNALYGWLNNHTLIAGLDHSTQELSQVDVLTGETQPLDGATLDVIPCES